MAKVKELMWAVREPPVFQLARAELPDLTSYPVRVLYDDGKEEIKNLRYADKLGLKPYQRGMQTAKFTFGGATLTFSVNYSEDKLTHIEFDFPRLYYDYFLYSGRLFFQQGGN